MAATSIATLTLTTQATGSVAESRFITYAGAQAGAAANTMGVNQYSVSLSELAAVVVSGTAIVEAGAAIAAGAALETDASGRAVTKSAGPTVGRALQAASGAGSFIEILLIQN